jgi:hypothetical protein
MRLSLADPVGFRSELLPSDLGAQNVHPSL